MSVYDNLALLREEILKCMKCGNCQAVCPIYKENRLEAAVARGKVQLADALLKGELVPNHRLAERFALCLTCKACVANCPCGVHIDTIILAARAELVRQKGLRWVKNIIFQGLKRPGVFDLGLRAGSLVQGLVMAAEKEGGLYHPRFPIGLDTRRVLPPLARTQFRDQLPQTNTVAEPRKKAVFFTGCMINYVYTGIGRSVVNVLRANGVEVVIPREQHCCGIPVLTHGDVATAKEMARSHVDAFSKLSFDALVVACATCGCAWKDHYQALLADDPAYSSRARELAARSFDISEFLVDHLDFIPPRGVVNAKVTYHDPCHLARGQEIRRQPRQVLQSIPGIELVEMTTPDRCCGGAGSFSITHVDISLQIGERKVKDIAGTGANTVVTSCPACRMQLEDSLHQKGMFDLEVVHTVQLLDMAYKSDIRGRKPEVRAQGAG